jgi:hypothetical protein
VRPFHTALVACIPLLLVAACIGDDPPVSGGPAVDAGDDRTPGAEGGTPPPADSGAGDQEAGAPACTKIEVTTLSGTGAPGLVNGPGVMAQFDTAEGITLGNSGTLFVADNGNKAVRRVLSDGTTSTYAVSVPSILSARRLAFRVGDIYLIDGRDDALRRITPGTPPVVGTVFQTAALTAVGASPRGAIYVSQFECYIGKVVGATNTLFAGDKVACGSTDGAAAVARFSSGVRDFAFDEVDTMYVVDGGNFRIRKVSETDGSVTTLAGSTKGHTDGAGAAAQFDDPAGVTVDTQTHTVYVADNTTIRAITQAGVVSTLVGTTAGFDDGSGCTAKFGDLKGITYYAGALYAVDTNRIRKIKLP